MSYSDENLANHHIAIGKDLTISTQQSYRRWKPDMDQPREMKRASVALRGDDPLGHALSGQDGFQYLPPRPVRAL